MNLSTHLLLCPKVHCSRMQTPVSVWGLPLVTFHLWLLFLSSSLHSQPAHSALVFSTRPEHGVGVLGSPLTLPCAAFDSLQQRAVSVSWERASGEPALEGLHLMANGSLFWPRLREQDLGRYFCKASAGIDHIMTAVQVELADLGPVFHSPQSVLVSEGESVSLQCVSGDSSPPAHVTWLRGGAALTRGKQIQGQYGGGSQRKTSGALHLSNVSIEDQGEYVCVTHNSFLNISRKSHAATLTVLGAPRRLQITHGPDNITVAVGTEASMSCVVRGFPVPTVMWFKDGRPLANGSSFSMLDHGRWLVFRNVSEEHEGRYHCEARNEGETVRSQPAFLLPAVMDWDFVHQPSDHTVRRGGSVTLVCRPPHSRPPAQLAWFKNNTLLPPDPHYTLAPQGDLTFHSVQESDSGTYLCRASNPYLHRSVTSRRIRLKVLAPPTVRLAPLVATVPVGAQVLFQCQVWGHPVPSIKWHKQGLHWETGGRTTVGVRNASLFIQSVRSFDEGMYTCEAANALGRVRSTATLRVAASPIIVPWLGQVRSLLGRLVVLQCRAVGVLPISYTWSKGDLHTPITASQERRVDDDGTLQIISVQWSDGGQYQCTAENRAGRQQRNTVLIVTAEDGPADTDKQTRHVLSAATHTEAQQTTPLSNKSNGGEQNSGTTHQPPSSLHRENTVQASPVDSTTVITKLFTLGNTLPLTSPREVSGLTGRHPRIPSDNPASDPTQHIVTQIQPPVPAELYLPPDLLAQSLVSNHLPWIPNPQPPLTTTQHSVTHIQSLLRIKPLNTHHTPSTAAFQLYRHGSTQASFPVTGVRQSWASSPNAGSPAQPPDLLNQSPSLLSDPTQLFTKSLSEAPTLDRDLQPSVQPLDPGLQPSVPPLDPGLQPSILPLDPGLQPSVLPLDPGLQPSILPLDPGLQPSVLPLDPGLQPSVLPLDPGLQPSVLPLYPGLQPSVLPLDPGLQPSVLPLDPGLQPSVLPLDPGLQPSVPPLDAGLQPSVLPLDPGLQPSVLPLDPGLQPSVLPLDPGLQPSVLPLDPGLQPSVLPLDPGLQPSVLPLDPGLQPSVLPLDPGLQPSVPPLDPGLQPSVLPLDPDLKPSDHHLFSASQSVFKAAPTQSLAFLSHSQSSRGRPQPSTTQSQPQPPKHFPQPPLAPPQPSPAQPRRPQNVTKPPPPQPHQPESSRAQTWRPRLQTKPTHPLNKASILTPSPPPPPPPLPLTPEPPGPDSQVPSSPPVTTTDPLRQNASQSANPAPPARSAGPNHPEPTERLKRNTSQSTMRTSDDPRVTPKPPSWLPVLEKHDIPIVVGVGVSLAFIFITMAFYSLVPKNEPTPIGRGVKRNLGLPCKQAELLATGKTYENRAFEDNELMAVIEQSPNTSDTRARPSTSPVPAHTDPSSEGLQEGPPARPTPEHSVIASLEPSQDTLVDTSLDEEKGCTLSHPSIQLQCVEDWMAGGPSYPSFPDTLPPPSPSPYRSRSPSPSPPSLREEAFRSSLTLRTAEPCATPVRHSLSISHGNMPLLLSHCVSLGLTTVAVDVHFFPAASAASATAGQLNTTAPASASPQGSQISSRLAHSQENDLLISSMRQSK